MQISIGILIKKKLMFLMLLHKTICQLTGNEKKKLNNNVIMK